MFLRSDSYGRFVSALVFLPRHRYSTVVRLRIEQELKQAFRSSSLEFEVRLRESPMARVFFRILLPAGGMPDVDPASLERSIVSATRTWAEGLDKRFVTGCPRRGQPAVGAVVRRVPRQLPGRLRSRGRGGRHQAV